MTKDHFGSIVINGKFTDKSSKEKAVFNISHDAITTVHADSFLQKPAGEATRIVTEGVMLHEGLAALIPKETTLIHLTSIGNRHVYSLSVRDYTVAQFIAIAKAYAGENFDEANRLVDELRPRFDDFD